MPHASYLCAACFALAHYQKPVGPASAGVVTPSANSSNLRGIVPLVAVRVRHGSSSIAGTIVQLCTHARRSAQHSTEPQTSSSALTDRWFRHNSNATQNAELNSCIGGADLRTRLGQKGSAVSPREAVSPTQRPPVRYIRTSSRPAEAAKHQPAQRSSLDPSKVTASTDASAQLALCHTQSHVQGVCQHTHSKHRHL